MNGKRLAPIYEPTLKESSLFKDLSELELNAVVAFLEPCRVKKGEVIFEEGTVGEEMFVLVSGKINAWVNRTDGSRHLMFEIVPGDFFGEMSIIANESRSATLTAAVDTELLVFHGIDFFRIIFEHPMIGIKMLSAIKKVQNVWLEQTSRYLGDLMRWGETARRRAVCDEITGLYNRRFLEKSAGDRFEGGVVGLRSVSLLMLDLDKIHEVNDRYGTKAGDLVFVTMAEVLLSATRPGDICSRLAGDEFAVLLPDTSPEDARLIAEKIRASMNSRTTKVSDRPDGTGQAEVVVSTSIGVASAPTHANTWESLNRAADFALRCSKQLGRNRVEMAKQSHR